jgi:CRISPR system Cascade subunit CasE
VDRRKLALLTRQHGHDSAAFSDDEGYHVHAMLKACFGVQAPKPFAVDPENSRRGQFVTVLAYGGLPWTELLDVAQATGDVQAYNALIPAECASKPLPQQWKHGARYRYRVRVCPIRRGHDDKGKVQERDVFLTSPQPAPEETAGTLERRAKAYSSWLREQIESNNAAQAWSGSARLESCNLESFRLARLARQNAERKLVSVPDSRRATHSNACGRPDVVLSGVLSVTESSGFGRLLARGIGRHRAFGFGMLLLKPV